MFLKNSNSNDVTISLISQNLSNKKLRVVSTSSQKIGYTHTHTHIRSGILNSVVFLTF